MPIPAFDLRSQRPVAFQPREDRVVDGRVERGVVGAHPGFDGRVQAAFTVAWSLAAGRVDIDAAEDVAGADADADAEHGVGEPAALSEVSGVPLQVAEIVSEGHLAWPVALAEPRRRADVIDAGRPGSVVGLVVLRTERGQPEVPRYELIRYREVFRNE